MMRARAMGRMGALLVAGSLLAACGDGGVGETRAWMKGVEKQTVPKVKPLPEPKTFEPYGYDPRAEGFAWFAGQGGFGIQTAPAAARLASQLLLGLERDAMTRTLDAGLYAPERFG